MRLSLIAFALVTILFQLPAASQVPVPTDIRLIVKADDMGAAHGINTATIDAYRRGIVRTTNVIVPGPWFLEAVKLLKENPGLDVGVHLAITSEWDNVKWTGSHAEQEHPRGRVATRRHRTRTAGAARQCEASSGAGHLYVEPHGLHGAGT
jgi:hypothetical protein